MKYLWDTNIAIYFLQQQLPLAAENFLDQILKENPPVISSITEIELLCWQASTANEIEVLRNFINDCITIELETAIKLMTPEVQKTRKLKLPDAIIAATALVYNLTLLTRNVNDFKHIAGLTVINPWEV